TGKPVPGVRVYYFPMFPNGEATKLADYTWFQSAATAGADGSFAVPGLPGSGIVGAVAPVADAYHAAGGSPGEMEAVSKEIKEPPPQGEKYGLGPQFLPRVLSAQSNAGPGGILMRSFNALSLIHPDQKDQAVTCELVVQSR